MISRAHNVRVSERDRRALWLGLRLAAPALLYAFVLKPYVASIRSISAQLATQVDLLAREQALVADAPSLPRRIAMARAVSSIGQRRMYRELDPIASTAALSRDVARAFADAGVSLQRVETRESSLRPDGLRELAIDARADGGFEGILSALASLEAGDRLVRITRLAIDVSAQQQLTIVATIRGYMP
jgi:type II secretory pathway component PulM